MKKKLIKILLLLTEGYPQQPSKLYWVKFFRSNTLQISLLNKSNTATVNNPFFGVLGNDLLQVKESCDRFINHNELLTPIQLVDRFDIITIERLIKAYDTNRINPIDTYTIRIRDKNNSWYETYNRPELKDKSLKEVIDYFKKMIDNFNKDKRDYTRRVIAVKRHAYKFYNYYLKETQFILK